MMEFLNKKSNMPQKASLILGFFDGIHVGHREVIKNCPSNKKILVTFSSSPAEFFNKNFEYIYSREYNYKLLEELGIDYIYEQKFEDVVSLSAEEYLEMLIKKFSPISITSGINHTFGNNRLGNSLFLKNHEGLYKYFCTELTKIGEEIVCSSRIKQLLSNGEIEKANQFLSKNFVIKSTVIEGAKLGRELGFPTANLPYPKNIIRIPYGVYVAKVFNKSAIMNWGIKPTIGSKEIIEVHIPNFNKNLYGELVEVEILGKIRDEKKFENLEELKLQIKKDVEICLKW